MANMRKLMEAARRLDEYFVKEGMTLGDAFMTYLEDFIDGTMDDELEDAGYEYSLEYLKGLKKEILALKKILQPVFDVKLNEKQATELDDLCYILEGSDRWDSDQDWEEEVSELMPGILKTFKKVGTQLMFEKPGQRLSESPLEEGEPNIVKEIVYKVEGEHHHGTIFEDEDEAIEVFAEEYAEYHTHPRSTEQEWNEQFEKGKQVAMNRIGRLS